MVCCHPREQIVNCSCTRFSSVIDNYHSFHIDFLGPADQCMYGVLFEALNKANHVQTFKPRLDTSFALSFESEDLKKKQLSL